MPDINKGRRNQDLMSPEGSARRGCCGLGPGMGPAGDSFMLKFSHMWGLEVLTSPLHSPRWRGLCQSVCEGPAHPHAPFLWCHSQGRPPDWQGHSLRTRGHSESEEKGRTPKPGKTPLVEKGMLRVDQILT